MVPMMQWWSRLPLSTESLTTISRPVSSPSSPHLCECCGVVVVVTGVVKRSNRQRGSTEDGGRPSRNSAIIHGHTSRRALATLTTHHTTPATSSYQVTHLYYPCIPPTQALVLIAWCIGVSWLRCVLGSVAAQAHLMHLVET